MNEKTVLIVEDEKAISDIIKFNIEGQGFTALTAYDGMDALAKVDANNPDLILLDVMLPKLDGFEVCRQIRAKSDVPIIMLTAKEEKIAHFRRDAHDFGLVGHSLLPIDALFSLILALSRSPKDIKFNALYALIITRSQ